MNTYAFLADTGQVTKFVHSDSFPVLTEDDCDIGITILQFDGVIFGLDAVKRAVDAYRINKWWAKEQI
jgi:hypothetical protein